jgi:hypothetical protein
MKTIVDKQTNTSRYLVDDDYNINMLDDRIEMGDPNNIDFIIGDLNFWTASIITDVTAPEDWTGCKYTCSNEGVFTAISG